MIPHWNYVTNCQVDSIGRIWVGWNPDKIKLSILLSTTQIMYILVENFDLSISFTLSLYMDSTLSKIEDLCGRTF